MMAPMGVEPVSKLARIVTAVGDFLAERGLREDQDSSRLLRFAHFWLMVARDFVRNRCLVRASALAYTTLLALVPLLAVGVGVTTSLLKQQGDKPVQEMIDRLVAYAAPALNLESTGIEARLGPGATNAAAAGRPEGADPAGRAKVVRQISGYIQNIHSGALTTTSVVALLFVCISLLRTIEAAFNDIWGVTTGRSWLSSIVYYWTTISLGPLVMVVALSLTAGGQFKAAQAWIERTPFVGTLAFKLLPYVVLSGGFAVFYGLMPNTRVRWTAALAGGVAGGCLWQLNNELSVLYVSNVVSYTSIYGSLGLLPLFLAGLYFSWTIVLLGAQIAHAFQNRQAYVEEKIARGANQRGREFVALRLVVHVARAFHEGRKAPGRSEIAAGTGVPSRLAGQILAILVQAGLLVEVGGRETGYAPARPLDQVSARDVLEALRTCQGQEFNTKDDPARALVRSEYERICAVESQAAGQASLLELVGRLPREPRSAAS